MKYYTELEGDLITMTQTGEFDLIAHGTNCFNNPNSGLAPQMEKHFNVDKFRLASIEFAGDINKLGQIDFESVDRESGRILDNANIPDSLIVVNAYTQFKGGSNLDYDALVLCLKKLNYTFAGLHIGLPKIGCGVAGGDWDKVRHLIKKYLVDMCVTIVVLTK